MQKPVPSAKQPLPLARSCRLVSTPLPALEMSMLLMQIRLKMLLATRGASVRPGEKIARRHTGGIMTDLQVPNAQITSGKKAPSGGEATASLAIAPDTVRRAHGGLCRQDLTLVGRLLTPIRVRTSTLTLPATGVLLGTWRSLMFSIACWERPSAVARISLCLSATRAVRAVRS